jgi:transcriptional regulator with XRE-family HTH domain
VDDRTVGLALRALRRRLGWRQVDLAAAARASQSGVSRAERGHIDELTVAQLRQLFGAVDARLTIAPSWRGAALERLLDDEHAQLVAAVAAILSRAGWAVELEVTYSRYGERGSVDVLALNKAHLAALVVEVKSDVASSEELGRKVDEKARLAPGIVFDRSGWRPRTIGRVVVMPETTRLRRPFDVGSGVLNRMFPATSRDVRAWLRNPSLPISGRWFLSPTRQTAHKRGMGGRQRVRRRPQRTDAKES